MRASRRPSWLRAPGRGENALQALLVFVPAAAVADWLEWQPAVVFVFAALAIVPLAGLMGRATETLAARLGAGVGGLLDATFGNAAELIIALMALRQGLHDVVKASLTGSIIGNVLLGLGLAFLLGGIGRERQTFDRAAAAVGSTPAYPSPPLRRAAARDARDRAAHGSPTGAMALLLGATALVAWMSERLVASVEAASHTLGLTEVSSASSSSPSSATRPSTRPTAFEVVAVVIATLVVNLVAQDGESHWLAGALRLAVDAVIGLAFSMLP